MEHMRKHLSPALVLSVVAVFIALGGGAYAALGKNSVGSKQIKKNAVVASKIKKDAVVTSKIKNDNVTGPKVKESSLGTVPSATNAARVDGYLTFPQTRYSATSGATEAAALSAAPENVMFNVGPITIYSKCITYLPGPITASFVFAKTSENGVIFDSDNDDASGSPAFLNTGTPEADRGLLSQTTTANSANTNMDSSYASTFMTPSGVSFEMQPAIAAKNGTLPVGNGLYGEGDACLVTGSVIEHTG